MKEKKIITLVGLMGVGKTTIGAKLANRLGFYFFDSDQEIEHRSKKTISEIFAQNGEKFFRQLEKEVIFDLISRNEEMVLSLGGGAFVDDETRKILKEKTLTVWLCAEIDDILYRVGGKENRPLLNQKNKREILQELAAKRYPIYRQADLNFNTSNETHEAILTQIAKKIHSQKE